LQSFSLAQQTTLLKLAGIKEIFKMEKITKFTILYGLGLNVVVMAAATIGMLVYGA
jgi:hypothetical protein